MWYKYIIYFPFYYIIINKKIIRLLIGDAGDELFKALNSEEYIGMDEWYHSWRRIESNKENKEYLDKEIDESLL
jgi:hypothetical protein